MRHSAVVFTLLLTVGTLVQCGKDPLKRKGLAASLAGENEVIKSSVPEVDSKDIPEETEATGETENNETSATFSITVSSDGIKGEEDADKDLSIVPKPRPGMAYFTQLQGLLSQFLAFIGLRSQVERKHRGIEFEPIETNEIGSYKDGLKTTLGAVMGQRECFKKVACRAGKYLKTVKGKEIIIVVLEKVTPSTWLETVRMLKESAIHNDKCEYKCLD